MWRKLSLLMCVCVLLVSCTAEKAEETADVPEPQETVSAAIIEEETVVIEEVVIEEPAPVVKDALAEEMEAYETTPNHWTIKLQEETYDRLFEEQDYDRALEFRNFIESLAQYHHNEPVYEYNPVFLCYEKYPEVIPLILDVKPDLFTRGSIDMGTWSKAPIVYVLQNLGLEEVKFYFENEIPFLDVRDELLYGTMNRGGPRFGIGGNILTYAKDPEVIEYMISQGVPAEVKASRSYSYYLKLDEVEVHGAPGNDTDVVGTIAKGAKFSALSVLTYKIDDTQWMKISFDDKEGWIPSSSFGYDSGI